ncbi:MAG: guanylate kinase [Puniceicoccaceae bacterium]|nr:MAG: guanylate kinase [Puniceicoccaceae bacterium]
MVTRPPAPALLLIVAGPTASGKTTLCERMVAECPGVERVVTSTTRPVREGEVHGRDYYFFRSDEFECLAAEGAFLETAEVHGNRYGTLRSVIEEKLAAATDLVMNIDVQGVRNVRRAAAGNALIGPRLVTVFILPPNLDELRQRLVDRGTDDEAAIERRLETARGELAAWSEFDFCIVTRGKEEDFRTLHAIWTAEKNRVARLLGENSAG